jgi:predicted LPLAT superfamily acyltransferase
MPLPPLRARSVRGDPNGNGSAERLTTTTRPEAGGRFAIWLIRETGRLCGRRFVRPFLYPITLYFYLRRGVERRASAQFLERVRGRRAGPFAVLAHIHAFASIVLDRLFMVVRGFDAFDIRLHGLEHLQTQIARGRGILLLGAHHGSFEALSVLRQMRPDVPLKIVMDNQSRQFNHLLYALDPRLAEQVVEVGGDPAEFALQLQAIAQRGGVIGMLGDRSRAGEAVVRASFLGAAAEFPAAPYLIASMLEMPIVLGFGLYRGGRRYDLHFELLAEPLRIARGERAARLRELAQRYAARLEHYARLAPYNWFNFYDFWRREEAAALLDPATAGNAR